MVVRERPEVTDRAMGKGSFGRVVLLHSMKGIKHSFGRDVIVQTV